jgi:ATP synthase protein I
MDQDSKNIIRMFSMYSTVGLVVVFATLIGAYIGKTIDQWLNTSPWFTAIFFILGLIGGFKNLYTYSKRSQERLDDEDKKHD